MDPRERQPDEARLRQQEESLARRAGSALNERNAHGTAECPDGEILAAYAEQGLSQAEAEKWEGHFATCGRCRKTLLALGASADTPLAVREVAPAGERALAGPAPLEITRGSTMPPRARFAGWRRRWLAPAIGVAAALVVWFAARPPWRATDRGQENLVAQAPRQEVTPPSATEENRLPIAPPPLDEKAAPAGPVQPSANVPPKSSPGEPVLKASPNRDESEPLARKAADSAEALQKKKELDGFADQAQIQSEPAPAPAPARATALPPPQSAANQPVAPAAAAPPAAEAKLGAASNGALQANSADASKAQGAAATGNPSEQQSSDQLRTGPRRESAMALARPPQKVSSVVLQSPFGSEAWRVGSGGRIEHSADGGETWNPQTSPSGRDWLAGVAVSDMICWIAGKSGAIARTTDGEHWELIAPPSQASAPAGNLPDWVAITARDAQRATVTAMDGRKFATADVGKTWQAQ